MAVRDQEFDKKVVRKGLGGFAAKMANFIAARAGNKLDVLKQNILHKMCQHMSLQSNPWVFVDPFPFRKSPYIHRTADVHTLLQHFETEENRRIVGPMHYYTEFLMRHNEVFLHHPNRNLMVRKASRIRKLPTPTDIALGYMNDDCQILYLHTEEAHEQEMRKFVKRRYGHDKFRRIKHFTPTETHTAPTKLSLHEDKNNYQALAAATPSWVPRSYSGLVYYDLGNEMLDHADEAVLGDMARDMCERWPTSVKLFLYPIGDRDRGLRFLRRVARAGQNSMLMGEVLTDKLNVGGLGVMVVNPPEFFDKGLENLFDAWGLCYKGRPIIQTLTEYGRDFEEAEVYKNYVSEADTKRARQQIRQKYIEETLLTGKPSVKLSELAVPPGLGRQDIVRPTHEREYEEATYHAFWQSIEKTLQLPRDLCKASYIDVLGLDSYSTEFLDTLFEFAVANGYVTKEGLNGKKKFSEKIDAQPQLNGLLKRYISQVRHLEKTAPEEFKEEDEEEEPPPWRKRPPEPLIRKDPTELAQGFSAYLKRVNKANKYEDGENSAGALLFNTVDQQDLAQKLLLARQRKTAHVSWITPRPRTYETDMIENLPDQFTRYHFLPAEETNYSLGNRYVMHAEAAMKWKEENFAKVTERRTTIGRNLKNLTRGSTKTVKPSMDVVPPITIPTESLFDVQVREENDMARNEKDVEIAIAYLSNYKKQRRAP